MRLAGKHLYCIFALMLSGPIWASQGELSVYVAHRDGQQLEGVVIGVLTGDPSSTERTNKDGQAWIQLPESLEPGDPTTLFVRTATEDPWFIVSPWEGHTQLPRYDSYLTVILVRESERAPPVNVARIVSGLLEKAVSEFTTLHHSDEQLSNKLTALTKMVQDLANLRDNPDAPPGVDNALSALADGDIEKAEDVFEEILDRKLANAKESQKEAAEAARNLGLLNFFTDSERAVKHYRQAVELDPENTEGWHLLGSCLLELSYFPEAKLAFRRLQLLGESTDNQEAQVEALLGLASIYTAVDDLEETNKLLSAARKFEGSLEPIENFPLVYIRTGAAYLMDEDHEVAEKMVRKALDENKRIGRIDIEALAYNMLGGIYYLQNELGQSEEYFQQVIELSEQMIEDPASTGNSFEFLRRDEILPLLLPEVIRMSRSLSAHAYKKLGLIYRERSEFTKSELALNKAIELGVLADEPGDLIEAYTALGELVFDQGARGEALEILKKALGTCDLIPFRDRLSVLWRIGQIHLEHGILDEAANLFDKSLTIAIELEESGATSALYVELGAVYALKRNNDKAQLFYNKAREKYIEAGRYDLVRAVDTRILELSYR